MCYFDIIELLISFFLAFAYVLMFYLQRIRDNVYYFGFGEVIYGLKTSIKPLAFFIKAFYIYTFAFFSYLFFRTEKVVILGVVLGSFLIVWPAILNPKFVDYRLADKRKTILLSYLLFVLLSAVVADFGVTSLILIKPMLQEYLNIWHDPFRLFVFLMDGIFFTVISCAFIKILKVLNREVRLKTAVTSDIQDYEE
ncbi:MAG: hypothetical protein HPY66_1287 [Firmicutes bacterium]|nr:hypothetical protein [Bacillota bacterium]